MKTKIIFISCIIDTTAIIIHANNKYVPKTQPKNGQTYLYCQNKTITDANGYTYTARVCRSTNGNYYTN